MVNATTESRAAAGAGTTAALRTTGADRGLSIVVPLHNEAASLARMHTSLIEVARTLGAARWTRL